MTLDNFLKKHTCLFTQARFNSTYSCNIYCFEKDSQIANFQTLPIRESSRIYNDIEAVGTDRNLEDYVTQKKRDLLLQVVEAFEIENFNPNEADIIDINSFFN
ncbi:hypothetical protein [uncultured Algibacter sp.]|uniref:hypothetical protein n=1 Tax=uncultured Algibacter sp. TaxID=298659 RepID=UPI00262C061A|nr:hypothetical protein [uncultured Algibacter sp.]